MSLQRLLLVRRRWDLCSCISPMLRRPSPLLGRVYLVHNDSPGTLLSTLPSPAVFLQSQRTEFAKEGSTCRIFLHFLIDIALDCPYESKTNVQCDSNEEHVEDELHVSGRDVREIWISRPSRDFVVLVILVGRRVISGCERKYISLVCLGGIIAIRVVL